MESSLQPWLTGPHMSSTHLLPGRQFKPHGHPLQFLISRAVRNSRSSVWSGRPGSRYFLGHK